LRALAGLGLGPAPRAAAPPVFLSLVHIGTSIDHCLSRMREQVFLQLQTAPYQGHEPHPPAEPPADQKCRPTRWRSNRI